MNPGDLLLDERTPPAVMEELAGSGHKIETRSRWNSGAAPVMIGLRRGQSTKRAPTLGLSDRCGAW